MSDASTVVFLFFFYFSRPIITDGFMVGKTKRSVVVLRSTFNANREIDYDVRRRKRHVKQPARPYKTNNRSTEFRTLRKVVTRPPPPQPSVCPTIYSTSVVPGTRAVFFQKPFLILTTVTGDRYYLRKTTNQLGGGACSITYLIFAFEHEHVGDFAERYAQMYDLGFGDLVGYVAYVYHPGRLVVGSFVEFDLRTKRADKINDVRRKWRQQLRGGPPTARGRRIRSLSAAPGRLVSSGDRENSIFAVDGTGGVI